MDLYQLLEYIRRSLQRAMKRKSPLNAPFVILKWSCSIQERKKTDTLQCFDEFANRKKERKIHEKKGQVAIKFLITVLLYVLIVMCENVNLITAIA